MEQKDLNEILERHKHWLDEDCEGWEKMRADLSGADLSGANLLGADLSGANLLGADLYKADLSGANLSRANLFRADLSRANLLGADPCEANLCRADLSGANLSGANLLGADLYKADLCRADLRRADLRRADLSGANLCRADLRRADLSGANLCGANLSRANLYKADLCEAKNIPLIPYACPDFGMFIGWKKAKGYIVCIEIPADAKRLSATGRKCRCDKAKVLSITKKDGTDSGLREIPSDRDENFIYRVGEMVEVKDFDKDRWNECSTGIHFFINRQEAVEY